MKTGRAGRSWRLLLGHDRAHRRPPQRPSPAAGVRNDDRARRPQGVRVHPRSPTGARRSAARSTRRDGIDELDDVATGSPLATGGRPASARSRQGVRRVPAARAGRVGHPDVLLRRHPDRRRARHARATSRSPRAPSTAASGRPGRTCWSGVASALVDNIPIMFAVLNMHPEMSQGHWLLVTLTAGVGRIVAVGRKRGRRRADGTGARDLHVPPAPALDLGRRARLRRQHRRSPAHQPAILLSDGPTARGGPSLAG